MLSGSRVEEACVDATSNRFGHAVPRECFAPAQADLEDVGLVFDKKPNGLAAELSLAGQIGDAVVGFKGSVGAADGNAVHGWFT